MNEHIDLSKIIDDKIQITFNGEELSELEYQHLKIALDQIFWNKKKNNIKK